MLQCTSGLTPPRPRRLAPPSRKAHTLHSIPISPQALHDLTRRAVRCPWVLPHCLALRSCRRPSAAASRGLCKLLGCCCHPRHNTTTPCCTVFLCALRWLSCQQRQSSLALLAEAVLRLPLRATPGPRQLGVAPYGLQCMLSRMPLLGTPHIHLVGAYPQALTQPPPHCPLHNWTLPSHPSPNRAAAHNLQLRRPPQQSPPRCRSRTVTRTATRQPPPPRPVRRCRRGTDVHVP